MSSNVTPGRDDFTFEGRTGTTPRSVYRETRFETFLRWLAKRCDRVARKFRYSKRGETGIRWWLESLSNWLVFTVIFRAWKRSRRV